MCFAESLTARFSTSVIPDGIQITILNAGGNNFFLIDGICFTNSLIISSEA